MSVCVINENKTKQRDMRHLTTNDDDDDTMRRAFIK